MNLLKSTFASLELKNPIIAASCSLTGTARGVRTMIESGVGAVVLKSLFEEDIVRQHGAAVTSTIDAHSEAASYMESYMEMNALGEYTTLIQESKAISRELGDDTPIIASINCHTSDNWIEYAKAIEAAGADALELNVMTIESSAIAEDGDLERRHIQIAQLVSGAVTIPIIMKLGLLISNHASLISRLTACGVKGFVLFNRLYQTDIDVDTISYTTGEVLSSPHELSTALRYTAVVSAAVPQSQLALSGGVQDGDSIIKALLAGASAVEVCSTLYRQGRDTKAWVEASLERVAQWQEANGYSAIAEYMGTLSKSEENSEEVMRSQFLKYFGKYQ